MESLGGDGMSCFISQEKEKMSKERIAFLDIMKAFGIIFVITYHVYAGTFIKGWLNCFQLPVFLFASGYLFHNMELEKFLRKRVQTIIIPYIAWGGVSLSYYFLIERHFRSLNLSLVDCVFRGLILGEGKYLDFNSPLWFLPCFFLTQFVYLLIYKTISRGAKDNSRAYICFAISFGIYVVSGFFPFAADQWSIHTIPKFLLFFSAGCVCKCAVKKSLRRWLLAVISVVAFALSALSFYIGLIDLLVCILGVIGTLCLSIFIAHSTVLEFIGNKTLTIVAVHGPIYRIVVYVFGKILRETSEAIRSNIFTAIFVIIISLVISLAIDVAVKKLKNAVLKL